MIKWLAVVILTCAYAGSTTVTGTIVDPNGNPYAGGTVSAYSLDQFGNPAYSTTPALLNGSGAFSITLAPATYVVTICGLPVNIGPSTAPSPTQVCFSSRPIVISGGSQSLTSTLVPLARVLGPQQNTFLGAVNNWAAQNTFNAATIFNSTLTVVGDNPTTLGGSLNVTGISAFGGTANANPASGDAAHFFEIINNNSPFQVFRMSTYGTAASLQGQNNLHFFRANGTLSSPSAILNNDLIMSIGLRGWDGTLSSLSSGAFQGVATENWNSTSHGTKLHIETTPNGSTARTGQFDFFGNGQIGASLGFVTGGTANSNLPGGDANYLAEIINNATSNQDLRLSTYGLAASIQGQNLIHLFRAGGTLTSPTAVVNNDIFGGLASRGYDGTVSSLTSGTCYFQATENWNNTSHGTKLHCETTPNTSITRNSGWDFLGNGNTAIPGQIVNTAATATMGLTLKKGSGAGDYVHSADTNFIDVDGINLSFTVIIPIGWKLGVVANAEMSVNTATTNIFLAINDSVAGTQVVQVALTPAAIGALYSAGLSWVITGDGVSHTVKLQYKTATAADAAVINNSATRFPTLVFTLMPSN